MSDLIPKSNVVISCLYNGPFTVMSHMAGLFKFAARDSNIAQCSIATNALHRDYHCCVITVLIKLGCQI